MRLFRSEEHFRARPEFRERDLRGLIRMDALMEMFSAPMFRQRLEPDYVSRLGDLVGELVPALDELDGAGSRFRMAWYEKLGLRVALRLGL